MAPRSVFAKDLKIGVIGDEDTVAGFLLAGVGDRDRDGNTNFKICNAKTPVAEIEEIFHALTERQDIGMILINQNVADRIRPLMDTYTEVIPSILEIPSKECPYDPTKDSVMQRVKMFFGGTLPEN
ncbi:V-type proton ATPase subunit F [Gregarina niphandrodes]|uniref:V-type proton ATPase subunit F n=1 Tax=Gregarina niphandrodes TaxID=110365 RepID=A0A023B747_GRENI|nr:V-type proton ATPase subunit F [Gregarina niphandrodes]EZG66991.1 V-type proton ATPase subunit F [Gregarina niphandrodes]|eukprot:XP_011130378.1 V-type proton ATPase subunit F [Gregarina niphandrodes]